MGLLSWLTGGGGTANKVVDAAVDGLDALVFTDEEKSRAGQKILDFKLKWLTATSGQNVARRVIAIAIVALWVATIVLAIGLQLLGATEKSDFVFLTLKDVINTPFMVVIGFYFAAHLARGIKNG